MVTAYLILVGESSVDRAKRKVPPSSFGILAFHFALDTLMDAVTSHFYLELAHSYRGELADWILWARWARSLVLPAGR